MARGKHSDPRPQDPSQAQDPRPKGPPKTNKTKQAKLKPEFHLSDSEAEADVESSTSSDGV